MDIEFDSGKAAANLRKHGVSFVEASSAILDSEALVMEDDTASGENRWVLLGISSKGNLLTVVYTLRQDRVRVISARPATRREGEFYARRV